MRDRVIALARGGMHDDEVAAILTQEGHRSPTCRDKVLSITVQRIRHSAEIEVGQRNVRWHHEVGSLSAPELAAKLGIPANWLYVQIRKKRLLVDRRPNGAYLFNDVENVFEGVRSLRNHMINSIDLRICQPHQEGH